MKEPITYSVLQFWISVGVIVGGMVFSYASSTIHVAALQDRVSSVEVRQIKYDDNYNELKNSVTRIETLLEERLPPKKTY